MSFKYRFILSFVLLEIIFILLIVTINFITIKDSSEKLIQQKIESSLSFLDKMTHVPISIYDLASLDDITKETTELDYINSVIILDNQNRVLSKSYNFKYLTQKELLENKDKQSITKLDNTYEIRYKKIKDNDTEFGSFYMIFDTSENSQFINENQKNTTYLILIEILISIFISYIIGNKLTKVLSKLSSVAVDIGENKDTEIPFQNRTDEFGILSKSMNQMQIDLKQRNERLKNFTRELSKQKKELISANKSKDDFLANMSHELKTPLNSINVISSIMMKNTKQTLNEEHVKNLSIINNCGNDLLFLINDVLDVSKLEAGEIQLVNETLNFKTIMDNIYEMFNPQMELKEIKFVYKCENDIGYIYSDEQRIKQVIKNLLSNAVKFAPKGVVKFFVTDQEDTIKVTIEDNGIGIPENKLENIFDRFKQVDESTTRNYGGTGLGLAICKELTLLLGGEIIVKSKENEGTSFSITIAKNSDQINKIDSVEEPIEEVKIEVNEVEEIEIEEVNEPIPLVPEITTNSNISHDILILNNDPVSFFKLVIDLKKEHTVIQSTNTINFLDDYKNNKEINVAIIDASCIDKVNLEKIILKLPIKFILIYSLKLDIFENEKIIQKIKKPFKIEDIMLTLNKLKEQNEQV